MFETNRNCSSVSPASCLFLLFCVVVALSSGAQAQSPTINYDTAHLERRLTATRAAGQITLDGALDEAAWALAPLATGFIQNDPREGEPATFETEVRVLYDDQALYFGVFARDDQPSGIIVNDLKKDYNTDSSDGFRIIIDTFGDRRNGFQFAVNPAGAKWDAQMTNEGRENNANWDGIWDVRCPHRRDRLVRRNQDPVPDVEVRRERPADLGAQLRTPAAAAQRG
jgi:hypothetical protein